MSEVHVKGLKELGQFMQQLPVKFERNILRGALRAGANVIKDDAKSRVPVMTGRLRDSIRVTTRSKRGRVTATIRAGGETKKRVVNRSDGSYKVEYDNAYYAIWVEFGTSAHFIGARFAKALALRPNVRASSGFAKRLVRTAVLVTGVYHPGSKPRPFMRPAMDSKAEMAVIEAARYMREKMATKHGLDTSGILIEGGE